MFACTLPDSPVGQDPIDCYGITEAGVLAAGYAPTVGFIHTGKPLSFVYDIADLYKFDTVVPIAFQIAGGNPREPERAVRLACLLYRMRTLDGVCIRQP